MILFEVSGLCFYLLSIFVAKNSNSEYDMIAEIWTMQTSISTSN